MKICSFLMRLIGPLTLSLLMATSVTLATEENDMQEVQRNIQQAIVLSQQLQQNLNSPNQDLGTTFDLFNQLKPIDTAPIDALLASESGSSAPMTGTMVNNSQQAVGMMNSIDSISPGSLEMMFARLNLQLSQHARDSALDGINQIKDMQEKQKEAATYIGKARSLQNEAKIQNKSTTMPEDMVTYFKAHDLHYDTSGNDYTHTFEQWEVAIQSLSQYQEMLGMQTQQLMIVIQDYMGQYNAYMQGANSAIQKGNETLRDLARGQSLFSAEGGKVDVAPIATSVIVGIIIGMLTMWAIVRKKIKKQM
ncbi:MAG: hypothetical protein K0S22_903 [Oscillospiraceae bacterium]|jgi:hypothetical protein|nr:hypothetical protein [Oscillospiraceae bacterium]